MARPETKAEPPPKFPIRYLANDLVAAGSAAFFLSPFVCMVDKAIVANASGTQKLGDSLKENMRLLVTRPLKFMALKEVRNCNSQTI